jgi:hypothetical protein
MGTRKFRTPGSAQQSALESAKNLMAERLKYEQWLDDLEAKKDATPAKVFERVQKDYLERLQTVVEQLGKYTETLEQYAETLTGKLTDLQAMEEANEEEQAEQALRKQVGEITAAEWESGSRKAQKELAKIKENQEIIEADLEQIRDLLGDGEEDEDEAPAKGSKDFNELEFLSSVVGQSTAPIPAGKPPESRASGPSIPPKTPTPSAAAAPAPAAAKPRATPASTPAPRVSNPPAQPTPSQAAPATPGARPSNPAAAAPPASSAPTPLSTPSQSAAPQPAAPQPAAAAPTPPLASPASAAPAPPAEPAAEPVSAHRPTVAATPVEQKTLKCTECSTMNYATEWYCERCGAELTGA